MLTAQKFQSIFGMLCYLIGGEFMWSKSKAKVHNRKPHEAEDIEPRKLIRNSVIYLILCIRPQFLSPATMNMSCHLGDDSK